MSAGRVLSALKRECQRGQGSQENMAAYDAIDKIPQPQPSSTPTLTTQNISEVGLGLHLP